MGVMGKQTGLVSDGGDRVPQLQSDAEYRVLDVGRYVRVVWRGRAGILACALGGALLAGVFAWVEPPEYEASVRLMPPSPPRQTALTMLMPTRNAGDLYLGLITSRTVMDDVIAHQHLAEYFHTTKPSALRGALHGMAKIAVDKDQFVTVTVRAKEPETAMRIANEFPEGLYRLNHAVALSEAGHRWEFYEAPLEDEKNKLEEAEEKLKEAEQTTGVVLPEAQVQLALSAIAGVKQQIAAREEQLAALHTNSTEQSPGVMQLRSELAQLSSQLHALQARTGGDGSRSTAKVPELTLEIQRLQREVKFHEALFEVLSRQYENARIEDAYSAPVELVDRAVLPDEKAWPRKRLFVAGGFVAGGLLGMFWVLLRALQPLRRIRAFLAEDAAEHPDARSA